MPRVMKQIALGTAIAMLAIGAPALAETAKSVTKTTETDAATGTQTTVKHKTVVKRHRHHHPRRHKAVHRTTTTTTDSTTTK